MSPEIIKKQKQKQRKKVFRKWHRRMGFAASLFLFNLAITGIMLNHYETLSLHKNYISSSSLLNWYNVKAPKNIICSKSSLSSVCQIGGDFYLNNQQFTSNKLLDNHSLENRGSLISFAKLHSEFFLVTDNSVTIYTDQFDLVESINTNEIFSWPISKANIIDQTLVIQVADNEYFYDQESFEFQSILATDRKTNSPLVSSTYKLKDREFTSRLNQSYRQHQITQLKFIQDLHSGQLFSLQGKLLTDITGIIILLLAISGFITWQRRKNNK
jgi:hypothetical protein